MEKKDLITIELQILSISITLMLGTGAGVGLVLYTIDFSTNILSQCILILVGSVMILSGFWALNTYLKINDLKK